MKKSTQPFAITGECDIFEATTGKKSKMNIYKSFGRNLAVLLAMTFASIAGVQAQNCKLNYSGSECVGTPLVFTGDPAGTTHDMDFNGENTSSGQRIVSYAFKTPGNKTITYITTVNGQKCTSTLNLTIKTRPIIKFKQLSAFSQCFANNLFCFQDSTHNPNGAKIVKTTVVVNDGQIFTFNNPTLPQTVCFSYKNPTGGNVCLYVESEDANGCVWQDTMCPVGLVYAKISPRFLANGGPKIGCNCVTVSVTNVSGIPQNQVKSAVWYWGNGTTSTGWGPNLTKTYCGAGVYNTTLVITTNNDCVDSFTFKAIATVVSPIGTIYADKDSACIADARFTFGLNPVPVGFTSFVWNWGPAPPGWATANGTQNRTSLAPTFTAGGLGPQMVSFTYKHPICGDTTIYDTVLVIGPVSVIEIPFNRIAEHEVFQCPKDVMDSVHFKNFSTFYHNDLDYSNDDSTVFIPGWGLSHVFTLGNQKSVNPTGQYPSGSGQYPGYTDNLFRQRVCAVRLWDFGDSYAAQCTTDVKENKNVGVNCNYSRDTLPVHYYKSWDLVLLSDFKGAPMEDAIFVTATGLCKKLNVWPSDSFYIIVDSLMYVPRSGSDSALANGHPKLKNKYYLREKTFTGPGERYLEDYVDFELKSGDTAWYGPEKGPFTRHIGPKTLSGAPKNIIILKSATDKVDFLFTIYPKRDTLPLPLLNIKLKKGDTATVVGFFKRTFQGIAGYDYIVDYNRFRELYYAKIPRCNNVKLKHHDTCHPLACEHEATKTLALMHANAGGVGSGLLKESIECLGGKNPSYGVTFVLSDLKPGCTFSDVQINFDTFCNPKAWVPMTALSPGGRPPGLPWAIIGPYQKAGNPSNRWSTQYSASMVCGPKGCVTVGMIVGNGVSKSGTKPLCADTQYYDHFACFPLIDPSFEVVTPLRNPNGIRKCCKNDPIVVRPISANKTNTRDLKSLRWELSTGNASPYYSKVWRRYVQEDYFSGKYLKDSGTSKIYNYMVISRGGDNVKQVPCTNIWNDGISFSQGKPDTIITAAISKWDTAADVSAVWDNIKSRLEARGFDPFSLTPTQIAKMIWNNVGTIGQPQTGAYGCIDTTGFGKLIVFYLVPDPNYTKILSDRDTNIRPVDYYNNNGTPIRAYTFRPQWSGYHIVSISMTSSNGKCDEYQGYPVIVGFAMMLEFPDSIVCQDQGSSLAAKPDYRMFHPDPINFGTWDTYDYWRDYQRQLDRLNGVPNREARTSWDWSKADDDPSNPATYEGKGVWGGSGVGTPTNPWIQLGGGGSSALYYQNDSGVYTFTNIAGDSTGCMDTITRRVFITRLDANFKLDLSTPSCNSIIEFFDSSHLYDPCNWGIRNCDGPTPTQCDFIIEWQITWGDGTPANIFKRNTSSEEGLPPRIAHKYSRNGWFYVNYILKTNQGCSDTIGRWVKIPGPRPRFEFTTKAGNFVTICAGDSIEFSNLTDSATTSADWTWFFGDQVIDNTSKPFVWHTYKNPGVFKVFLQQYDSLIVPPNIYRYCNATYPDTPLQAAFTVVVLGRDSVRGTIAKSAICPGDENSFDDLSDTAFKTFNWRFENLTTGEVDSVTTPLKTYTQQFWKPGTYKVTHTANYDPNKPNPWCPTNPVTFTFIVDSVVANFDIDSSNKPDFCFTRTDINGTQFRWGFGHQNDIVQGPLKDFIEQKNTTDKKVCWSYDSTGVYWVCLIATNGTGCSDTICKPVRVDLFIYIANVFTPDEAKDNYNPTFRVPIQGQDVFEIQIFNRWGERVFMSEDPKIQWNGRVNNTGGACPEGTYFYQLKYRFKGKDKVNMVSGSVNLIR